MSKASRSALTAITALVLHPLLTATGPLRPATAQSAPDLSGRIDSRSQVVERYLGQLRSPNQATRVAAFAEMTSSGDSILADLALKTALSSEDPALQSMALRAGFRQINALMAKLVPDGSPQSDAVVKACGNAVSYRIENYSEPKGTFEAHGNDTAGVGQVSGTTVSITLEYGCSLSGKLQRDGSLVGVVSAPYKKGTLPMRINFR